LRRSADCGKDGVAMSYHNDGFLQSRFQSAYVPPRNRAINSSTHASLPVPQAASAPRILRSNESQPCQELVISCLAKSGPHLSTDQFTNEKTLFRTLYLFEQCFRSAPTLQTCPQLPGTAKGPLRGTFPWALTDAHVSLAHAAPRGESPYKPNRRPGLRNSAH
jgi:hypothetical protein